MALSREQFEQFHDALISAFPTNGDLDRLIRFGLGENPGVVAGGINLSERVTQLLTWVESNDQTKTLLAEARRINQGNAALKALNLASTPTHADSVPNPSPSALAFQWPPQLPRPLNNEDQEILVQILARQAAAQPAGQALYFNQLVMQANLPQRYKYELGSWGSNTEANARQLIIWADSKGTNPQDRRITTLGEILRRILESAPGDEYTIPIAAIIVRNGLYVDPALTRALMIAYQIPSISQGVAQDHGPDIEWEGPVDDIELQGWLRREPPLLDVGFLKHAVERAAGVCRIDIPSRSRTGSGVLIGPDLVLTNYHVLRWDMSEDLDTNARDAVLHFGYFSPPDGREVEGQRIQLDATQPIVVENPTQDLDFVLLRVSAEISQLRGIVPLPYSLEVPIQRDAIHILQHPGGATMMLGIADNGVAKVMPQRGLVQYITQASAGSSGAPCFNDDWEIVALHHAQRARSFGCIREGILFRAIYEQIKHYV